MPLAGPTIAPLSQDRLWFAPLLPRILGQIQTVMSSSFQRPRSVRLRMLAARRLSLLLPARLCWCRCHEPISGALWSYGAFMSTNISAGLCLHSSLRSFAHVMSLRYLNAVNVLFMWEKLSFMDWHFIGTNKWFKGQHVYRSLLLNHLVSLA